MTENISASLLLQKHFDTALETPDGIKKLRALILTLAMQGKLVPQDPADQPASELLKELEAENISQKNKNWKYVKLNQVYEFNYGKGVPKENISNEGYPVYGANGPLKYSIKYLINNKCLIIGRKGSAGAINISDNPCWPSDVTYYVIPPKFVDFRFAYYNLSNLNLPSLAKGIKPGLNRNEAYELIVGLPPLAEQHRIVAKIDQLMALCDELEEKRNCRDEKRLAVHASAINRLLSAPDGEAFATSWDFITAHFNELYSVRQNVADLKKAILQLAVMGKLVPQDPADQPASELLKEIEAEKKQLVKDGKIRKQEPLPAIKDSEIPYEVPVGWVWCHLDDLCSLITDGTHHTPTYLDSGIPFLSVKNLSSGYIDFSDMRFISKEEHQDLIKRCNPEKDDVLLTKVGTTGIGVTINTTREFSIFVSVALLKLIKKHLYPEYITSLINSPLVKKYSADGTEGVGNKNLVLHKIKNFVIPLPPLAEQKRIVAKIDQLMALCDELDKQIIDATEKKSAILNAVLASI